MPTEIEVKLRIVDPAYHLDALLEELQQKLGVSGFDKRHLHNIYFDTAQLDLNQARVALRLREVKGQWLQTFKTAGQVVNGVHRRGEWEWPVEGAALDQSLLRALEVWPVGVSIDDLQPVFETNFDRYKAKITYEDSVIEFAIDVGEIVAQTHREPIYELELELLQGEEQGLYALSQRLQQDLDVELYDQSKAERGYALFNQA